MAHVYFDSANHEDPFVPLNKDRIAAARAFVRAWGSGAVPVQAFAGQWPGPGMKRPDDLAPGPAKDPAGFLAGVTPEVNNPFGSHGKGEIMARMVAVMAEQNAGSEWARTEGFAPADSMAPCVADYSSPYCRWWRSPDGFANRLVWYESRKQLEPDPKTVLNMLANKVNSELQTRFTDPVFRIFLKFRSDAASDGVVPHLPTRFLLVERTNR